MNKFEKRVLIMSLEFSPFVDSILDKTVTRVEKGRERVDVVVEGGNVFSFGMDGIKAGFKSGSGVLGLCKVCLEGLEWEDRRVWGLDGGLEGWEGLLVWEEGFCFRKKSRECCFIGWV